MLTERRLSRRFFAAFAAIAVALVASSMYANWLSVQIDSENQTLVTNALPSIAHLDAALDAVSGLETAVDDFVGAPAADRPAARLHVDEVRSRLNTELQSYRELPAYPGESSLYHDEPDALRRVDAAVANVFAAAGRTDDAHAALPEQRELSRQIDEAAAVLRRLVHLNAAEASVGAARIRTTRNQVSSAAFVLNAVTLVVTALMAVWLWRLFRSFSGLQAEHAKLLERRAQELEVFGSRVAHDMLSPLSSLTFCLSSFKSAAEGDPKLQDGLRRARQCVARAHTLVNGLFEFARSGGEPEPAARADIVDVVPQIVEDARATDPTGAVQIDVAPLPRCDVRCTGGVLTSILGNLLRNAVLYMGDSPLRRVAVRVRRQGDMARFEVEDTGPGIPPGFEDVIFEPYARGPAPSQPGLGLGLATVKRLCGAHGGAVGVSRAPSGGSIFWFTVPIASANAVRATSLEVA